MKTTPADFKNPHSTTNKVARVAWAVAYWLLFRPTLPPMWAWRCWVLRLFGAKLGYAKIHPSVRIWAPWLLRAGNHVYIDKHTDLYNAYGLEIGDRVIISRRCFLCTTSHDHKQPSYPLIGGKISIGSDCWVAAEVFVGPGVTVGDGSVVGARAVVIKDVPKRVAVAGNPARVLNSREFANSSDPTLQESDVASQEE